MALIVPRLATVSLLVDCGQLLKYERVNLSSLLYFTTTTTCTSRRYCTVAVGLYEKYAKSIAYK